MSLANAEGPCGSGPDKCIQPWAAVNPNLKCNRCHKALHQLCAAIDATRAPEGQFEDPTSIQICYGCLRLGESPNNFGITIEEPPTKKAKLSEQQPTTSQDLSKATRKTVPSPGSEQAPQTVSDLDWETLLRPHESIVQLVKEKKVCAPQASKKTLWWRVYHTWNMEDFGDEVVQPLAYCNLCGKVIKMSKVDRSPTPLKRHLQIHHKQLYTVLYEQKLKDGPVVSPPGTSKSYSYSIKKWKREGSRKATQLRAIVQWIIETDQSPSVVESEAFRKMVGALVMIPKHTNQFSKKDIEEYMFSLVGTMRDQVKDMVANRSLVHVQEFLDVSNRLSYRVDRIHWISEDFALQSIVLACDYDSVLSQGEPNNDGMWESVGVNATKQIAFTMSNCRRSKCKDTGKPIRFHGLEHELDQIASVAYESLGAESTRVLERARGLVRAIQSSQLASEFLHKAQGELSSFYASDQIPVSLALGSKDEPWWSTQEMISRLLYLRKALEYLMLEPQLQEHIHLLTNQEWELLEKLQQVWEPFNIAPQLLQQQRYVTISLVPIILHVIGDDLHPTVVPSHTQECVQKMAAAWDDRFGQRFPATPFQGLPSTIWLAHILDPRFKSLEMFAGAPTLEDSLYNALLEQMVATKLYVTGCQDSKEKKEGVASKRASSTPTAGFRAFASSRLSGGKHGLQILSERLSATSKAVRMNDNEANGAHRAQIKSECQTEIAEYKAAPGMQMWIELSDGSKEFEDPLTWWQRHHEHFPTLWKLARMYLPIPATCAPSDRAFDLESYIEVARRYEAQASTSPDMKLLKENSTLVGAFSEQQETENDDAGDDQVSKEENELEGTEV